MKKWYFAYGMVLFVAIGGVILLATDRHLERTPHKVPQFYIDKEEILKFTEEYEELTWLIPNKGQRSFIEEKPSVKAYGMFSPVFDQAILSLKIFRALLDGGYEEYLELVHVQPKANRLHWKEFQELAHDAKELTEQFSRMAPKNTRRIFETAILFSYLGQSEPAQNKGLIYEIQCKDPLDFMEEVLKKHPEMFPSYCLLSPKEQKQLEDIFFLIRFEKLSQWPHAEKIFSRIRERRMLEKDPIYCDIAFLLYQCIIGGKKGDIAPSGSLTLNHYTFNYMKKLKEACSRLGEMREEEVFYHYLTALANWLNLDLASPLHRLLVKISMMMDVYTAGEIKTIKEAFLAFSPEELSKIIDTFEVKKAAISDELYEELCQTLSNLSADTRIGKSEQERLKEAITVSFKEFLAKEPYTPEC